MAKHRRYGRNQKRQHREKIAELEAKLALSIACRQSDATHYSKKIAEECEAAAAAQNRLRDLENRIRRFAASSTLLDADTKIDAEHLRIPVQLRAEYNFQDWNRKHAEMPIEQVMHIIMADERCQQDLSRRLHFTIKNAPNRPGETLRGAYATTHHEIACMQPAGRAAFTEMICRTFGAQIHNALFGKPAASK